MYIFPLPILMGNPEKKKKKKKEPDPENKSKNLLDIFLSINIKMKLKKFWTHANLLYRFGNLSREREWRRCSLRERTCGRWSGPASVPRRQWRRCLGRRLSSSCCASCLICLANKYEQKRERKREEKLLYVS
jgi:hypothetical protein